MLAWITFLSILKRNCFQKRVMHKIHRQLIFILTNKHWSHFLEACVIQSNFPNYILGWYVSFETHSSHTNNPKASWWLSEHSTVTEQHVLPWLICLFALVNSRVFALLPVCHWDRVLWSGLVGGGETSERPFALTPSPCVEPRLGRNEHQEMNTSRKPSRLISSSGQIPNIIFELQLTILKRNFPSKG